MKMFPRSRDRGLIEALCQREWSSQTNLFPRSRDRGLIEALDTPTKRIFTIVCFRDREIAASLKQTRRSTSRPQSFCFRDREIAASLKQSTRPVLTQSLRVS